MPLRTIEHLALESDAGRADVVVARLCGLSRARVRGLLDHGGLRINDAPCTDAGTRVGPSDRLTISFDPERRYRERPAERQTRGFKLVYSDETLVVVDKEAGVLTVPADTGGGRALIDLLATHLGRGNPRRGRVSIVHRLDRDTSGLLVFGRSPQIARAISDQFTARKPEREYAAIVAGTVAPDHGTIRSHLATDKALNQRSVAGHAGGNRGELAITHYQVHQRLDAATLLSVRLETGRRNQIRAHFAELGHPVLGDVRYESDAARHAAWPHARLALHARVLGFTHPVSGQSLRFESPLPREFEAFIQETAGS